MRANTKTAAGGEAAVRPRFWDRNSWKFLLALVAVIGLFGVGDMVRGMDADPAIPKGLIGMSPDEIRTAAPSVSRLVDLQVRSGGLHLLVLAVVWTAVLLSPYRRGERWAWWVMWTYPGWALAVSTSFLFVQLQPDVPPPPPAVSGWALGAATAMLLLASRRRFGGSSRPI